jgi:hypothetical protein
VLGVAGRVGAAARADDGDAEELGRDRRQRRVDPRDLALGDRAVARVGLVDPGLDDVRRRQLSRRDIRGAIVDGASLRG